MNFDHDSRAYALEQRYFGFAAGRSQRYGWETSPFTNQRAVCIIAAPIHFATAAALNLLWLGTWWEERPKAKTRVSPFLALAPQPA